MTASRSVACPTCGSPVEWSPTSKWRPFCSERCKLIDVGAWATGAYRVPLAEAPDPIDLPDAIDESKSRQGGEPS
ncbi:MAG: DNA gyrase inhibitor YacG [Aromatoleum sp.]|nr:DNA gyrase inhibitor YacG [Aromatoleum sp.]